MSSDKLSLFAVLFMVLRPALADDLTNIEGDPTLVGVLIDAQRNNKDRFPQGEMKIVVEKRTNDKPADRRVSALVRWRRDDCRASGMIEDRLPDGQPANPVQFEVLYNKNRRLFYLPEGKLLRVSQVIEGKFPPQTRLRPDEWFYGNADGEGLTWLQRLDGFGRLPPEIHKHCRAVRVGDDQIQIARNGGGPIPGEFVLTCSLARGGNVLQFKMFDPQSGIRERFTYEWEQADGGEWYPKTAEITTSFPRTKEHEAFENTISYKTESFNPSFIPPATMFEDAAIKLPPGTTVEDDKTGRRTRTGDRPESNVFDSLDKLITSAKSRGFGARPQ